MKWKHYKPGEVLKTQEQKQERGFLTSIFKKEKDQDCKKSQFELTKEQMIEVKQHVSPKLDQIDALLKKDCIFCGTLLLDMIDNDIKPQVEQKEIQAASMESATQETTVKVNKYWYTKIQTSNELS